MFSHDLHQGTHTHKQRKAAGIGAPNDPLCLLENSTRMEEGAPKVSIRDSALLSHSQQGLFGKACSDNAGERQDVVANSKTVGIVSQHMAAAKYNRSTDELCIRGWQQFGAAD